MDVQSAQPPPYHFMFDANAHGLGAGAQMEVSKYPGGSIQQEQYRSGYRQFKPVPGRAYVYGPSGNWGNRHYYKYTPIKQNAGASGVLSQIAQPNAYKYKVANLGRMGRVDPQLPRGGSIMRVVGVGGGDDEGDMRAFDSSYDWRNSGQPGPVDVRPATDVGRADLPVEPPTPPPEFPTKGGPGIVYGLPEISSISSESSEDSPPPLQIPTSAIIEGFAAPPNVNAGLPSADVSEMSADSTAISLKAALAIRAMDEAVDMEIDEFNTQMIQLRGSGPLVAISPADSFYIESRVDALIEALRATMTENTGELPANVLVELEGITDSMTDALADYKSDVMTAEELWYHIEMLAKGYKDALRLAAGSDSTSSGSSSPSLPPRRSRSSSASSKETKLRKREGKRPAKGETFEEAKSRKYGESSKGKELQVYVPKFMNKPATTPSGGARQGQWLTSNIEKTFGKYIAPKDMRMIANNLRSYVVDLARDRATEYLGDLIDYILRRLNVRGNPRNLARQIVAYLERRLQ